MLALPCSSQYWKATWPFSNSARAISSLTTNLPSPWLTAIWCTSPTWNDESHGEATVAMRVRTRREMWRLMLLRYNVGDSGVTSPILPYGSSPDLTKAWKPLQMPRINPLRVNRSSTAAFTLTLFNTLAMNLPLPSGSSPKLKPPLNAKIWDWRMASDNSSSDWLISASLRLRNTKMRVSAPASSKALAVS